MKGNEDKVKCLDGFNLAGQTPLHVACFSDKSECVKALLVAGADVNKSAGKGAESTSDQPPGVLNNFMNDYHNKLQTQVCQLIQSHNQFVSRWVRFLC